jgi:ABC-type phosphate transport system substrate-binding protein
MVLVHCSDRSGTTFNFTAYLTKVSRMEAAGRLRPRESPFSVERYVTFPRSPSAVDANRAKVVLW